MKKIILISAAILIAINLAFSQGTAINNTGVAADNSAILDVSDTTKGILIPRITTTQRNAISTPALSLLIFNITTNCFESYVNGAWNTVSCPSVCILPAAPLAAAAGNIDCNSFMANWTTSTGATSYYLDVATDIGFTSFVTGYNNLLVGNITYYNVTGLASNTSYYYRVRAAASCASGNSNIIGPVQTISSVSGVTASVTVNPICSGDTLYLTGNAINATSWNWTGPNSFSSSLQNPQIINITSAGSGVYTLTASNSCYSATPVNTASVIVNAVNTLSLSSAVGTDGQTVCINMDITNITYNTTGATGANVTGLPAGVTGNWLSNVVTISGTPTASGTFNYTVILSGGCGNITANGSITVNATSIIYNPTTYNGCYDIIYNANTALSGNLHTTGNVTINNGVILTTNGYSIIAGMTFTNNGTINAGNPGNGGTATSCAAPGGSGSYGVFIQAYTLIAGTINANGIQGSMAGGGGSTAAGGTCNGAEGGSTIVNGGEHSNPGNPGNTQSAPSSSTLSANLSNWYSSGIQDYIAAGGGGGGRLWTAGGTYNGATPGGSYPNSYAGSGGGGGQTCSQTCDSGGGGGGGTIILASGPGGYTPGAYNVSGGAGGASNPIGCAGGAGGNGNYVNYSWTTPPVTP